MLTESGHGCSMLGVQIRFVGLVARVRRHPVLLGGKRMNDAGIESSLGECPFHWQVVVGSRQLLSGGQS
jgi:hypothetical protein